MAPAVTIPVDGERGLAAGDTVVLSPAGGADGPVADGGDAKAGTGGAAGPSSGERGADKVVGTVVGVDGAVVTLRCPASDDAARFPGGRAVEVVSLARELTAAATVLGAEVRVDGPAAALVLRVRLGETLCGTESRSWTRVPVEVPVCVSAFGPDGLRNFAGRTRNLSVGGLLMHSFAPVPAGSVVAVVHLDGRHRLAVLAETLEAFRPRDGERGWMARLRFVATEAHVVEVIRGFVVRALVEQRPTRGRPSSGCDELAALRNAARRRDADSRWWTRARRALRGAGRPRAGCRC